MIHVRPIILNDLSSISMIEERRHLNLAGYMRGIMPSIIKINAKIIKKTSRSPSEIYCTCAASSSSSSRSVRRKSTRRLCPKFSETTRAFSTSGSRKLLTKGSWVFKIMIHTYPLSQCDESDSMVKLSSVQVVTTRSMLLLLNHMESCYYTQYCYLYHLLVLTLPFDQ